MAPIAHQSHKQNYEKYRLQPNKTAEIVVEGDRRRHKPQSVIRPKWVSYYDFMASFQLLSAFLSASCFHSRFDIARYAFNATDATCSKQTLTRIEI